MPPGEYQSALFQDLVRILDARQPPVSVLDLGPTTTANLAFWTERGFDLSAYDLAARSRRGDDLQLGAREFDAVVCWNALAALAAEDARDLVKALHGRLRPGGVLFAIFDGDGRDAPAPRRYRIVDSMHLMFVPETGEDEVRAVSTQEVERLLAIFGTTRTTVMRHGAREAFGRAPMPPRTLAGYVAAEHDAR